MPFGRRRRAPAKANLEAVARRLADPWEPSDQERLAAELRAQGADEETVARWLAEDTKANTVQVLRENAETVKVYCRCAWTVIAAGMPAVLVETGISATEIEAACRLLDIPPGRWAEIAEGVRIMANTAGPIRNKRKGRSSGDDDFASMARAHAPGTGAPRS